MTQNKERKIGGGISKDQRILQNLARNQATSTLNCMKKKRYAPCIWPTMVWCSFEISASKHHLLTLLALYFLLLVDTFKVHVYVLPLFHITQNKEKLNIIFSSWRIKGYFRLEPCLGLILLTPTNHKWMQQNI